MLKMFGRNLLLVLQVVQRYAVERKRGIKTDDDTVSAGKTVRRSPRMAVKASNFEILGKVKEMNVNTK